MFDEYQEIKSQPPEGTFDNARLAQNQAKVSSNASKSSRSSSARIIELGLAGSKGRECVKKYLLERSFVVPAYLDETYAAEVFAVEVGIWRNNHSS